MTTINDIAKKAGVAKSTVSTFSQRKNTLVLKFAKE